MPNWYMDGCSHFWTKNNQSSKWDFDPILELIMHYVWFDCFRAKAIEFDCEV